MYSSVVICSGLNADPDPAFDLNSDPDPEPGAKPMQIHADPEPGQTLMSKKAEFLHEKYTYSR